MSLGSNLKSIRLFRKKTLKELGQGLGFSLSSADVRISQYEKWKYNFPKYSTLNANKQPHENWLKNK